MERTLVSTDEFLTGLAILVLSLTWLVFKVPVQQCVIDRLVADELHKWAVETLENECRGTVEALNSKHTASIDGLIATHKASIDGLIATHKDQVDRMATELQRVKEAHQAKLASMDTTHQAELQEQINDAYRRGIAYERQRHLNELESQRQTVLAEREERVSELEQNGRRCVRLKQRVHGSEDPRCMNPIPGRGKYVNNMGLCSTHYQMHMASQSKIYEMANKTMRKQMTTAVNVLSR